MTIKELIHYLNYSGNETQLPVMYLNEHGEYISIDKVIIREIKDFEISFKALVFINKWHD
jgi:hypothetical protein